MCPTLKPAAHKFSSARLTARTSSTAPRAQAFLLRSAASFITRILSVFGLASAPGDFLGFVDAAGAAAGGGGGGGGDDGVEAVLDAFTAFRWA